MDGWLEYKKISRLKNNVKERMYERLPVLKLASHPPLLSSGNANTCQGTLLCFLINTCTFKYKNKNPFSKSSVECSCSLSLFPAFFGMYVCILRGIAGQRSNVWKIGLYWIRNLFLDCVSDNKAKRYVYVFHSDIYFFMY